MAKSFEQFRHELADHVTVAINSGRPVEPGTLNRCPLGCLPNMEDDRPTPSWAKFIGGVSFEVAHGFIEGFDGRSSDDECDPEAFNLGRLYRERFTRAK